jgi:hypothetical protein
MVFPLPLETMAVLSKTKGSGNLACVIREQGIPKGQSEERRWRSTFTPPSPHFPHPQRHHPHTASPLNLLPPALIHPQPLSNQLTRNTSPLQLPPPGVQHPPAGRNLDQEAPIQQEVEPLAVGVASQAGVGRKPTRSGFRRTHKLQQDAHTSWPQILGQRADPPTHKRCRQRGYQAHRCWLRLKSWS